MKDQVEALITQAIQSLQQAGMLPEDCPYTLRLDRTKDKSHGDLATNIALVLAKSAAKKPRELAELIVAHLPQSPEVTHTEVAGPGFINFFLNTNRQFEVIEKIIQEGKHYGLSTIGHHQTIQVEFVSANPTGPLHVGHGRGAAYGATVANLLEATGFDVCREYYVNDAGRQMNILATSIWLRYLELGGETFQFPSNGYQGEYVKTIAKQLANEHGHRLLKPAKDIFTDLPEDAFIDDNGQEQGDKEAHIDALIKQSQSLLGKTHYQIIFNAGLNSIIDDIRDDLQGFGVNYQTWFSEKSLADNDAIKNAINQLQRAGHLYEDAKGALWFRSTTFGDDKDRVILRDNGQSTYFASDIAYHLNKFNRGFDKVINIWGADHHGYVPRVKAALQALAINPDKLDVLLVQFAILYRGKERVQMSTRSGSFVTLRELREEVSNDAARFFYILRKSEQHMDFDLELAKSQSKDNPVYYVQYAHARICRVLEKLTQQGKTWDSSQGIHALSQLTTEKEKDLTKKLAQYPEVIEKAALQYEPHLLAHYLKELASDFHTYYNANKMLVDDDELRNARLSLSVAAKQVINNGLSLIGVSAPEAM
jgi:arginyl-tRNA synthetase